MFKYTLYIQQYIFNKVCLQQLLLFDPIPKNLQQFSYEYLLLSILQQLKQQICIPCQHTGYTVRIYSVHVPNATMI